ncbi:hypothetical protein HYFRA_00004814 [Hymenoscyphus fraxineus]|uniref:Uncharacterized protein n=1 Tax=Hymenoscyphus fraxineus TaxID=746836 RepID=A0A9N9PJY1_9HELO|nr:hypothetical protein HYFRA_00004814 [Hymenoscyphus fraxineus]
MSHSLHFLWQRHRGIPLALRFFNTNIITKLRMACASVVVDPSTSATVGYACTPGSNGYMPDIATCNDASDITLAKPEYLMRGPGRSCVVSTNFTRSSTGIDVLSSNSSATSVFQSCCTSPNIDIFVSSGYGVTGGPCGFAYCNISDAAAAQGFMSCLSKNAPGVEGKCFVSYIPGPSNDTTPPPMSNTVSAGTKNMVGPGMLLGFIIGFSGLSAI